MCAHYALSPRSLGVELCDNPTDAVLSGGEFGNVSTQNHQGQEVTVKTPKTNGELQTNTYIRYQLLLTSLKHITGILHGNA